MHLLLLWGPIGHAEKRLYDAKDEIKNAFFSPLIVSYSAIANIFRRMQFVPPPQSKQSIRQCLRFLQNICGPQRRTRSCQINGRPYVSLKRRVACKLASSARRPIVGRVGPSSGGKKVTYCLPPLSHHERHVPCSQWSRQSHLQGPSPPGLYYFQRLL